MTAKWPHCPPHYQTATLTLSFRPGRFERAVLSWPFRAGRFGLAVPGWLFRADLSGLAVCELAIPSWPCWVWLFALLTVVTQYYQQVEIILFWSPGMWDWEQCGYFQLTIGAFVCSRPKLFEKFRSRTHGRGEEVRLSSGWTLIGSELSSTNFKSLVRAERSFAIRYLNVVIKPLCGNLEICLNY